jgi:uncharacterized protein YeaO (DUF488 family)
MAIRLKRIYEPPGPEDGFRTFVERLWPWGLTKERAMIDLWVKEAGASTELRGGITTIHRNGKSSAGGILKSSTDVPKLSIN